MPPRKCPKVCSICNHSRARVPSEHLGRLLDKTAALLFTGRVFSLFATPGPRILLLSVPQKPSKWLRVASEGYREHGRFIVDSSGIHYHVFRCGVGGSRELDRLGTFQGVNRLRWLPTPYKLVRSVAASVADARG